MIDFGVQTVKVLLWLYNSRFYNMALNGSVCLVTGATRGIGKGIAVQLGEAKATVYITGLLFFGDAELYHFN